jgi:TM2 domain/GYF domain 2
VYYLAQSNNVIGPFGVMQLRRMASDRTITPSTHVTTGNQPWAPVAHVSGIYSRRSRRAALVLALFGGILGLDRFYLGKFGTGIAKLMTLAGLGVWWLSDLIALASRQTTDVNGLPLR